ncbi:fumarylacetoacetate (FAA) hydrolase [Methylocella silvestris BL2]|uniref:Fumarylacetoacetate (FAA) hydrolase n=1 Tax=Methylocella silvestris (strain DSM 15510 / CIP 108128 / LMG 27833 / NCIMB 13906 / BL2) TaxID=395965 RepID=B8ESF6_METSB|nr:fumarylacetoacetate hydrolase family protein [Methylocella silvestris]ACK49846.1 fumarylacetoacetate (FAA) hydrolase [Methylocella silvestris BL2]
MQENDLDKLGEKLAANRKAGMFSDLGLAELQSKAEAGAVQAAALEAYVDGFIGYALIATSEVCRHTLGLHEPIYTVMPNSAHFADECLIRLPQGIIGAQCELTFTMGRPFPGFGESIDRASAAEAIVACRPTIGLLGRRAKPGPRIDLASIADFGLHVATICGPIAERPDVQSLDLRVMTARIDDKIVLRASAAAILGHPLEAVVWLARKLSLQGAQINAGDIVATGSCAPILQVLPGQRLTVEFEKIGAASCRFE